MESRKNRKSEAMKNIIVLIEPLVDLCYPHWKLANLFMNRFSINEGAAFELLGVYFLRKCSTDLCYWNNAREKEWIKKEWNEARLQKGLNMNYRFNSDSKLFSERYDFGIINTAIAKIPKNYDTTTHFVCAYQYYDDEKLKRILLSGMNKHRIKSAYMTIFNKYRHHLVTKEEMKSYYKGEYVEKDDYWSAGCMLHSVNDDLELLLERFLLDEVRNESAETFCFPKLTEKEMKLVESKNEDHLESYLAYEYGDDPDVDENEMMLSDSESKFVFIDCERFTCKIINRPINGYFKRKIANEDLSLEAKCETQKPKTRKKTNPNRFWFNYINE